MSGSQKKPDSPEADVTVTLEVFSRQSGLPIGLAKLACTSACSPLRAETGQQARDLLAVDAVAAGVRATSGSVIHPASRNGLGYDRRELANPVVFLHPANIECLIVNGLLRRFECRKRGSDNVPYVHDGAPRACHRS